MEKEEALDQREFAGSEKIAQQKNLVGRIEPLDWFKGQVKKRVLGSFMGIIQDLNHQRRDKIEGLPESRKKTQQVDPAEIIF